VRKFVVPKKKSSERPAFFFFSNPAEVAATAAIPLERADELMVSRVPDTSRGRQMAQSDGLVRLTILSADGHPKGARVVTSYRVPNSSQQQQLSRCLPKKNLRLLFAPFFVTGNLVGKQKIDPPFHFHFFKTRKLTGFRFYLAESFFFFAESFSIFRNRAVAVATRFWV